MALSYKARRRWALVILLIGMPVYIVAVVTALNLLDRPPLWVEVLVYVALGLLGYCHSSLYSRALAGLTRTPLKTIKRQRSPNRRNASTA